jgi:hypothetical protein
MSGNWNVTVHYDDKGEEFTETVTVEADDDIDAESAGVGQVCGVEQVIDVIVEKE